MSISYLLDEHVDPLCRREMLQREPTLRAWCIGGPGAPPRGTPDPLLLRWCEEWGFVLVTSNRKSMPVHLGAHLAEGRHVPGIVAPNDSMTIGDAIDYLLLIWAASDEGELRDRIAYLPEV